MRGCGRWGIKQRKGIVSDEGCYFKRQTLILKEGLLEEVTFG